MNEDFSQEISRHRFFKGCTRPAMFVGVPLIPFLLVSGCFLLVVIWLNMVSGYLALMVLLIYLPLILVMRQMTKKDDQRLKQVMMRVRMRTRHSNKLYWGSVSFSPLRYKKRKA